MYTRSLVATSLSCVLLLGASATVSAQDDPAQLLSQALQATSTATSFHFLATADGTINLGAADGRHAAAHHRHQGGRRCLGERRRPSS